MKLWETFRFELAYQGRRAWPWLFGAVLLIFSFLMTRDGALAEALQDDFFVNSSFAVTKTTVTGSLIWLLIAAAIAGEAAARDVAQRMHPLTYTMPVGKWAFLGGRFLAALAINALLLLVVQAGILLAVYLPGVDAALIGPFRPAAYLTAYGYLALPNAFVATALQFGLALRSGRPMAGYLASVLLFFMSYVVGLFLLLQGRQDLANLLDPIGVHFILSELSHLWTTWEKSWRVLALEGTVLTNRLLWLGVGLGALALTFWRFRFIHRAERSWWRRGKRPGAEHAPLPAGLGVTARAPIAAPRVTRTFGLAGHARQVRAIAWTSFRTVATSWAGLALLVVIPLLTIPVVIDQMETNGVPLIPATMRVLNELTAPLSAELSRWVIVPLLIVFFAGELVWRERDAGMGEITDALPASEWTPLLGKLLGLGLVLALFTTLQMAAGIVAQTILGYQNFEIGLYLRILFGLQLPEYLLFACLALALHVLVDQKYIGHLVAICAYVVIALASMFGIEHKLLIYGASPAWSYTEMRGFGPTLEPWLWFKLYWAAWALLLVVAARLLWVRGHPGSLRARLQLARRRLSRPTRTVATTGLALVLALGGTIFYTTTVQNPYRTPADAAASAAAYEQRYGQYRALPQPRVTATTLRVELYPARRAATIHGTYRLENRSNAPIATLHVATAPDVLTENIAVDRPAEHALADEQLGYHIYTLAAPLAPGAALSLSFDIQHAPQGFRNDGADLSVVPNGTNFTSAWLPAIGYQPQRELTSASERRSYGLDPRPLIPSLYDAQARMEPAQRSTVETVIGTDADQVAVGPGRLQRSWTEGGRRYFEYATDDPIGSEFAFFSARYAMHQEQWAPEPNAGQPVTLQVFHDPRHTANLDRTLRAIRTSLDYYSTHFGAYPRNYLSVVEHPGSGTGMHADAGLITYAEGFDAWSPEEDGSGLDLPFAIVAHEMAHQWTVPYAAVEGAPVMSESLAWFYGMQVVRENGGEAELRRLLSFMRQPNPYPPIRRGEPLLRGLDPYMSYRRGPFALRALSRYVGEDQVNSALRRLVEQYGSGEPPRATTLDLYRELQAVTPDEVKPLLHDLFEVNTFWELAVERATAQQTAAGTWQVTLEVRARKVVADETGVETEVPMDEPIEIGVFARTDEADELGQPLAVELQRVRSGPQTITVTVPREPALAGVDPYHLLDVTESENDDNIAAIER